jgi:glutaredoxin 2
MPAETAEREKLALYYYDGCPFCSVVKTFIDVLDVDVELRNTLEVPQHRKDLVQERGRATVPVLRIVSPDGEERWMPESRDISNYLQASYG